MNSLAALSEIRPMLLAEARAQVQREHPTMVALEQVEQPELRDALRERVAGAASEGEPRLRALAAALGPREVRRLLPGLRDWDDLRDAVAFLLRERARASLVPPLWALWQTAPEVPEVRAVVLEFGERFSWAEVVARDYQPYAADWVAAEEPGAQIRDWLDARGLSVRDLQKLAGRPFRPDTPLERLVREAVLTDGSAAQYRAEGNATIARWQSELSPQKALRFGRNYLVAMPEGEWYRPILNWIESTYGLPRKPKLASFWEPVPEPIRTAFQRIFIREKIQFVFRGDQERCQYWLTWLDSVADVEGGDVGGVDYGMLDFGSFGVVEVFKHGNAAYFYPPKMFERIRQPPIKHLGNLRQRLYTSFYPFSNRLIHREGWQQRADVMVRVWHRNS